MPFIFDVLWSVDEVLLQLTHIYEAAVFEFRDNRLVLLLFFGMAMVVRFIDALQRTQASEIFTLITRMFAIALLFLAVAEARVKRESRIMLDELQLDGHLARCLLNSFNLLALGQVS